MNQIQKRSLELLYQFTDICDKLGLDYFLVCGSALGAVKYEGFIPWDDDVDVAMKREDYERFLKEAPAFLPANMVLQNMHTNKAFPLLMTKLVNEDTALIEKGFLQLPLHHGIFLDIFPLDGYPEGGFRQKWFELRKWVYNKLRCVAYRYGYRMFGLNRIMLRYERLLKKYPCGSAGMICNYANWQGKLDYSPAEEYGNGVWKLFEGKKIRIPAGYDAYFSRKYGDWRKELPEEKQVSHHAFLVCDPDRSYRHYLVKKHGKVTIKEEVHSG